MYKTPETMPELRQTLASMMAGALNGTVNAENGRLALNAATRIIESVQAETRARTLAHVSKKHIDEDMPLNVGMFKTQLIEANND
jgi:hypothetical protein